MCDPPVRLIGSMARAPAAQTAPAAQVAIQSRREKWITAVSSLAEVDPASISTLTIGGEEKPGPTRTIVPSALSCTRTAVESRLACKDRRLATPRWVRMWVRRPDPNRLAARLRGGQCNTN